MMNRALLLLSAAVLLFSACNKGDDSGPTAEEDLRSGTWHRTSGRLTRKDSATRLDVTLRYDSTELPCRLDNSLQFNINDQGVLNLGSTHCSTSEPDTKAFQWRVTADGQRISIYNAEDYFPTDNVDADILTRTLGYLTIKYKVVTANTTFNTYDTVTYTDVLRRN